MMAETAPNKTVNSAGMRPAAIVGQSLAPAPAHRVKKILETYNMTAGGSIHGPTSSQDEISSYSKFYPSYHHHQYQLQQAQHAQLRTTAYKLPPDVELSKTTSPDEDIKSGKLEEKSDIPLSAPLSEPSSLKRSTSLHRRESSSDRLKPESLSPHVVNNVDDFKPQQNGLVTLSRVDVRERHGSSQSDGQRAKSCDSSHSGSSGRHLTGEMIRQLQEQRKGPPSQQQQLSASTTTAAATAAAQQHQLHQLQMTAAYERALKEKSYLRQDSNPRSSGASQGPPPPPPAFKTPSTSGPVFVARDRSQSDLEETRLGGRDISCYVIGGEKRLCLPQILNSVLEHITLPEIHSACDELQIFCSTCTFEQLIKLKKANVIPMTAAQCGLITKSDAERLCSTLLDRSPPLASMSGFHAKSSPFSFRVEHSCFGACRGILLPEAYTSPTARCIECLECEGLFCPQKFVCHSHRNRENRTCHWGFDSANWRSYLLLSDDYTQSEKDKLAKGFADFKARSFATKRKQLDSSSSQHPTNGGGSIHRDLTSTVKTEDPKISSHDPEIIVKKPRLSDPTLPPPPGPPHGSVPAMFPGDPAYGLYLYQSWAQAAAKLGPGGAGPMHPAAAAAWQAHLAQAVKEGKNPLTLPFAGPGSPASRLMSVAGKPVLAPPGVPSHISAARIIPNVKSSPISESESPTQVHDSSSSPGDTLSPTTPSHHPPPPPPSSSGHRRSSSSSSSSRPSLADDINAIRLSLEGASSNAREKILKILERLTSRLAVAESERDTALSQLKLVQKRFDQVEEELHKKRAELREALRQDGGPGTLIPIKPAESPIGPVRTNGGGPKHPRTSVTLELLPEPSEVQILSSHDEDMDDLDGQSEDYLTSASAFNVKKSMSSSSLRHLSTSKSSFTSVGLPKVDMKSPARIIEEKENRNSSGETPVRFTSRSPSPSSSSGGGVHLPVDLADRVPPPSPGSDSQKTMQRRRSGTPASIKSRESEDLRERMLTMEAELRALREELTSRPAAKAAKAAKASSTSSSNLNSSTEEQKDEKLTSTNNETPSKAPNGIKPTDQNAPPSNKRIRMSSSEDSGSKKVSVDKSVEPITDQDVSSKENKNDSSTNQ